MKVLDKGEVTLINSMGGDESVIAAARVSNGTDYSSASKGKEADQKLINYLLKHRHGTPFEHATFQFYVKAPLFVRSEWHRHRIASYNEISGRYVVYEPEFYIPDKFRVPGTTNKQGSLPLDDEGVNAAWRATFVKHVEKSYALYREYIVQGMAKEMARMVLPPNLYTQFYMTVNARALMNFLSLRAATDAQWEIRQYAILMREMFANAMPMTYQAWLNNDYVAP